MASEQPVLVLNPAAGNLRDEGAVDQVVRSAEKAFGVHASRTRKAGDAREYGRAARLRGATEVVVAGGDGTVHEVIQGFFDAERNTPETAPLPNLSILPLGTGNDLARCLGIPLDWREALARIPTLTRIRRLNLAEVELDDERCLAVNAVVLGSGGRVGELATSQEKELWGPLSYLRSAAEVALHLEPRSVRLTVNGGEAETLEVLNVVVANGRYAAGGIPIAPGALPWDGALELTVIQRAGLPALLGMARKILREEDPDHPAYSHRQIQTASVESTTQDPLPVSIDGETVRARRVVVRLLPGVLPVRIPGGG